MCRFSGKFLSFLWSGCQWLNWRNWPLPILKFSFHYDLRLSLVVLDIRLALSFHFDTHPHTHTHTHTHRLIYPHPLQEARCVQEAPEVSMTNALALRTFVRHRNCFHSPRYALRSIRPFAWTRHRNCFHTSPRSRFALDSTICMHLQKKKVQCNRRWICSHSEFHGSGPIIRRLLDQKKKKNQNSGVKLGKGTGKGRGEALYGVRPFGTGERERERER